jgi:RNA polymerase sigma-70 factor (ECF subfamily)
VAIGSMQAPHQRSDEDLVRDACGGAGEISARALEELYRRFYPRVASWCLRLTGDRDRAADLAQEAFLRVQSRLPGFRFESRFSTWLYSVVRSVVINDGEKRALRRTSAVEDAPDEALTDPAPAADLVFSQRERAARLRRAMNEDLEPTEAKILYLHYVDGMTLPAITELLRLENKSGAKAYVVSGRRKLERSLGRRPRTSDRVEVEVDR